MTIKHLVISGGGPVMIQILSAIQELESSGYIKRENIESIYGTSAGAIIGVLLSLHFDWETLNDYILKRPWHDVFAIKVQQILNAYTQRGIFDIKTIEKCFKPLLDAKDIPLNITLQEFYTLTKIELHFFAFEINEYKLEDISYKTYPSLELLQAIQMTCAIPILLTPLLLDGKCFMDGGAACNYPAQFCMEAEGVLPNEILGFKNKYSEKERTLITMESTLLDYLLHFLFKTIFSAKMAVAPPLENEFICHASYLSLDLFRSVIGDVDVRKQLFQKGKEEASVFLQNRI